MANRRKYHMYSFLHRIVHSGQPSYLTAHFIPFFHSYHTRNYNFIIPRHSTANFRKSFSFVAVNYWNGLPDNIKEKPLKIFQNTLKMNSCKIKLEMHKKMKILGFLNGAPWCLGRLRFRVNY